LTAGPGGAAEPSALPERFGLDTRARSALRAYFRDDSSSKAHLRRLVALEAALAGDEPRDAADAAGRRRFLDLFVSMLEADFSAEWLRQLAFAWRVAGRTGAAADLPLRAARALAAIARKELLAERTALSALEVEIVEAVAAAGMCVAAFLAQPPAAAGAPPAEAAGHQSLAACLAEALAAAPGQVVGLLSLRLRLAPAVLSLSREQRHLLWEAVIGQLRGLLRQRDLLLRTEMHGCAIVLPGLESHAQVLLAAAKLTQALEEPLPVGGTLLRAPVTFGAAWSPEHGDSAEYLIHCAEMAVEAGRQQDRALVVFDQRMLAAARQEAAIEQEFFAALENGRMAIHVQPQVDLQTGWCVGGELLLRWIDSQGREVPPWQIPEVAQRLGAAPQLTRWLVFGACRLQAGLIRAGVNIRLAVNLLARDVMDEELPLLVQQAIDFWRVPPDCLTFELIETMTLEDPEMGARVMQRLLDLGVNTSIDDFGIGYSSILYLRQLPLSELKIDRAFVAAMVRSEEDREVVAALIHLSHGLGLKVVAEGVEDEATYSLLKSMGCDRAQGYWISRAMAAGELPAWIESWNWRQG
jgi:EAL domain-containing protein (putative c-di-GMP-specific phosphodiesterase class I)